MKGIPTVGWWSWWWPSWGREKRRLRRRALPAWLTLSSNGWLTGSPPADAGGLYAFDITISNSAGSATGTFSLLVNQPTVINTTTATLTAGAFGSAVIATTGFPLATIS